MAQVLTFPTKEIWHSLCQCDDCKVNEYEAILINHRGSHFEATIYAKNKKEARQQAMKLEANGFFLVRLVSV